MSKPELKNKIVFITGASSGIGAACAERFAVAGTKLLLCARRFDRLEQFAQKLREQYKVEVHALQLDVADSDQVVHRLTHLPESWQAIDILINNAGLARGLATLQEGEMQDWDEMINANIKGLLAVTRSILPGMVARNSGHIINMGSVAGHHVYPKGAVYCATKYAVNAISQGLRMDLIGTKIRVSSVDPGAVQTEFSQVRFHGDKDRAASVYQGFQPLTAEDVADAIFYCAQCPEHVNVSEILLMPTAQASATMVHRREEGR